MAKQKVIGAVERIDRRNLIYHLLYHWVHVIFMQYYRKVEVVGLENIPKDAPVIFSPNHQNALMDALIVLFSSPGDTVFLARADLFRKKTLAFVLNSLKILPVFRIRDGVEELGKNQEIFDITVGILHRKHQLCLMPEGNHGDKRRLRTMGKGIFRIAFKTQEKHGKDPYVKIVPVGLDFSDYVKQYQNLRIEFGKPIEVSEYWETFEENGPRGLNHLKQRLISEMKPLMIDIQSEEFYDTYMGLRKIYNESMCRELGIKGKSLSDHFRADKEMIARLNSRLEEDEKKLLPLKEKVESYQEKMREMKIRDWVVQKKGYHFLQALGRSLFLVAGLPVFIYGFINNALMYFLPVRMVRGIKDKQFHSSVKAGASFLATLPISYALQTALVAIFTTGWYWWVGYLITVYPLGRLALKWYVMAKKTVKGAWFGSRVRRGDGAALKLIELRQDIIENTRVLIERGPDQVNPS